MLERLRAVNNQGVQYVDGIPLEKWTWSYDKALWYRHMTLNLAECINFIMKGTRYLLMASVVKETYFLLATLFSKWIETYTGELKGSHIWYESMLKVIKKSK